MKIILKKKTAQKQKARLKNKAKIRKKVSGTMERPRLAVYRSAAHTYAQLIDDTSGKILLSVSTLKQKEGSCKSKEAAKSLGMELAKAATGKKIDRVVFDRSGYVYHGRVKALADGAREGGLNF